MVSLSDNSGISSALAPARAGIPLPPQSFQVSYHVTGHLMAGESVENLQLPEATRLSF